MPAIWPRWFLALSVSLVIAISVRQATLLRADERPIGLPFGTWARVSARPLLEPQGKTWEAAGVFNPAVVRRGDEIVMLYRAQDSQGVSRLGYATSKDGVRFQRRGEPVLSPETEYETRGVEDPRLVYLNDFFYLTYTGYNGKDAQLCLAQSADLLSWTRRGIILPANKGRWNVHWTKSGAILDRQVNGHYWMYFMGDAANNPNQLGVAYSDDLVHWTEPLAEPLLKTRAGMFDSKVVEPGPPPVVTNDGILLIYNGADDQLTYRTGWAVFDANDPAKVLARADKPIFAPEQAWEKAGQVSNVVFVEGLLRDSARWVFYYGGADKTVGAAAAEQKR